MKVMVFILLTGRVADERRREGRTNLKRGYINWFIARLWRATVQGRGLLLNLALANFSIY